jgi:hypothetical protein
MLGLLLVLALGSGAVAQEPSPPPWFGGRVEMPEHGFAVTVPDGWVAIDITGDVDEQAWVTVMGFDPIATADDVRYFSEMMTRARSEGAELVLMEGLTGSFCGFNVTAKRAIETSEFADRLASRMSSDDRFTDVERPRAIELPAGPSFVVFGTFAKLDPPGPSPVTFYLVDADESVLLANCTGAERPEDDWLSAIETFEFLPAEE